MPKLAKELSAIEVRRLREPTPKPGLHFVGGTPGLGLLVTESGAASWVLRTKIGIKRRDVGLGSYPSVGLAAAREAATAARQQVKDGIDPVAERERKRADLIASQRKGLTFRQAAEKYIDLRRHEWKNAKQSDQWVNSLEQHAHPKIGDTPVADLDRDSVLAVVSPIWTTTTETANRVRNRIELVIDWAIVHGHRKDQSNPARWRGYLDKVLPKPKKVAPVKNHAALPIAALPAFMERLTAKQGMGASCLHFTILTAVRSGEARGATWSEIDLDSRIWSIPGERMKAGKPHRVPLSQAAIDLLTNLPKHAGTDLVFVAPRGGQLSDMTLAKVLRDMAVPAVPHGFRATFRTWAGETTAHPREVIEQALAHRLGDAAELAYTRGDLLARRSVLMADWAKFCSTPRQPATVTDLNRIRPQAAGGDA